MFGNIGFGKLAGHLIFREIGFSVGKMYGNRLKSILGVLELLKQSLRAWLRISRQFKKLLIPYKNFQIHSQNYRISLLIQSTLNLWQYDLGLENQFEHINYSFMLPSRVQGYLNRLVESLSEIYEFWDFSFCWRISKWILMTTCYSQRLTYQLCAF